MMTNQPTLAFRFADGFDLALAPHGCQPGASSSGLDGMVWSADRQATRLPLQDQRPVSVLGWGMAVATGLLLWVPIIGALSSLVG